MTLFLLLLGSLLVIFAINYAMVKGGLRFIDSVSKRQRQMSDKLHHRDLEERLQREGVATIAEVLDAADTGSRIDAIYILTKLRLQVADVDGVGDFTTEIVVPLTPVRIAQFVPGAMVKVLVDPVSRELVLDQPRK